jgi:hypothetical protein
LRTRSYPVRPKWADNEAIDAFYEALPDGFHGDHIVPRMGLTPKARDWLSDDRPDRKFLPLIDPASGKKLNYNVCGLDIRANLRPLPSSENCSRGNRLTESDMDGIFEPYLMGGVWTRAGKKRHRKRNY